MTNKKKLNLLLALKRAGADLSQLAAIYAVMMGLEVRKNIKLTGEINRVTSDLKVTMEDIKTIVDQL